MSIRIASASKLFTFKFEICCKVFSIKNLLQKLTGERTIKEKDYMTNPKKSGYSDYHIILGIPIVLSQQIINVKVEVQIRTMAMDIWSSIEHKIILEKL